jgi:hypothetical protein
MDVRFAHRSFSITSVCRRSCLRRGFGRQARKPTTHKTHVFGWQRFAEQLAALRVQLDSWMMRQGDAGQATVMKALERMPRNKGGEKQAKKTTQ